MLRILLPLPVLAAFAVAPAVAAPDDCASTAAERGAFIGARILEQLDLGSGPAARPAWMRQYMSDTDQEESRLAQFCETNPGAPLTLALERLAEPVAAAAK